MTYLASLMLMSQLQPSAADPLKYPLRNPATRATNRLAIEWRTLRSRTISRFGVLLSFSGLPKFGYTGLQDRAEQGARHSPPLTGDNQLRVVPCSNSGAQTQHEPGLFTHCIFCPINSTTCGVAVLMKAMLCENGSMRNWNWRMVLLWCCAKVLQF